MMSRAFVLCALWVHQVIRYNRRTIPRYGPRSFSFVLFSCALCVLLLSFPAPHTRHPTRYPHSTRRTFAFHADLPFSPFFRCIPLKMFSANSELSSHRLQNIIVILRRANSRYADIASRIRASLRPTFHARKRAAELRLGVDIGKAVRCEQRQVSIVPLPVLDLGTSPVTGTIAPIVPIICNSNSNVKKCPVLRRAIPTYPVIHPPRQVKSSVSRYHPVTDGHPFPDHHLPSSPVDDTPVEATPIGDEEINTSLFVDVNINMRPADVSAYKGLISWNLSNTDSSSASSTESRSTFPSSCSSSASDTNGPMTPVSRSLDCSHVYSPLFIGRL